MRHLKFILLLTVLYSTRVFADITFTDLSSVPFSCPQTNAEWLQMRTSTLEKIRSDPLDFDTSVQQLTVCAQREPHRSDSFRSCFAPFLGFPVWVRLNPSQQAELTPPSEITQDAELMRITAAWRRGRDSDQRTLVESVQRVVNRFPPDVRTRIRVIQFSDSEAPSPATGGPNGRLLFAIPRPWGYQYINFTLTEPRTRSMGTETLGFEEMIVRPDAMRNVSVLSYRTHEQQPGAATLTRLRPPTTLVADFRGSLHGDFQSLNTLGYPPTNCVACHTSGPIPIQGVSTIRSLFPPSQSGEQTVHDINQSMQSSGPSRLAGFDPHTQPSFGLRTPSERALVLERCAPNPQQRVVIAEAMNCRNCHSSESAIPLTLLSTSRMLDEVSHGRMPPNWPPASMTESADELRGRLRQCLALEWNGDASLGPESLALRHFSSGSCSPLEAASQAEVEQISCTLPTESIFNTEILESLGSPITRDLIQ